MAISKIILNGTTQIDVTDTTAVAEDVAQGKYFYGADGIKTAGTATGGGGNKEAEILSGSLSGAYENTTVTSLKGNALSDCTQMTSLSLPALTTTASSAIRKCTSLTTVNLPELTSIGTYCFEGDTQLNNVTLPKLGVINTNAFENCTGLTSASFPLVTEVKDSGLRNCRFSTIVLPSVIKASTYSISNNPNLTAVDFSVLTQLNGGSVFINDTSLNVIVIRTNSVATNSNLNHLNNTPFASGGSGGTLYVPQSLISSYESASNWSTILGYANNSIKSIESTHTDPNAPIDLTLYYADGTEIIND